MKKVSKIIPKKLSKKTLIIVGTVVALVSITAAYTMIKSKDKEEPVTKSREYSVKRGDIVIGVKGTGSINLEGVDHNFDEPVTIGEVFVKEGQEVKAGDKLMSISSESLQKKLDELNDSLKKANINLEQARNSKNSTDLNNKKTWNDSINASTKQYEGEKNQAISAINKIKGQIEVIENRLKELEVDLEGNRAEIEAKKAEISSLEGQLNEGNQNLANIESARQKQLEQEKKDAASNEEINNVALKGADNSIRLAELEVEKIKEDIEKVRKQQESPTLLAKVDGVVSAVGYKENATTTPETTAIKIGSSSQVVAKVNVEESDIKEIQEGQLVNLEVAAFQGEKIAGKVKEMSLKPSQQGTANTYGVVVEIDANDYRLLEGMSLTANFITKEVKDVLMLANKAITFKDGKQMVKVKDQDGTLKDVEITTGFSDGRYSEILSGLSEGDVVAIGG